MEDGDYPEYKQIVAVDGRTAAGEVTVSWQHNTGYFHTGHTIVSGNSRVVLPTPFIIENDVTLIGQFIRPEIEEEPAVPTSDLLCIAIVDGVFRRELVNITSTG